MSLTEVVEEPSLLKPKEDHDRHCRCYKREGHNAPLVDDIEPVTLQKSTYYSRVTNDYTQKRIVKGGLKIPKKGFRTLRDECLKANKLYEDPEFPPNDYSINFDGVTRRTYVWKRPHEIIENPRFFIDGATRFDIQQGELGDCWLLAAVSNLTLNPQMFHVVVPRDQGFIDLYAGIFHFKFWQYGKWQEVVIDDLLPTYGGRLVFMHSKTENEFWCALLEKAYAKLYGGYESLRGGNINESMVDMTGGVVEMIDLHNPPPNIFSTLWKAHRRGALIGCAIEPNQPGLQAESILCNGLIMRHAYSITRVTTVDIKSVAPRLQNQVTPHIHSSDKNFDLQEKKNITPSNKAHLQGALATMNNHLFGVSSVDVKSYSVGVSHMKNIIHSTKSHLQSALTIVNKTLTSVSSTGEVTSCPIGVSHLHQTLASLTNWNLSLAFPEGKAELVRLHNPWGNEAEWKGSWSDKSPEWNTITPEEKQRLGLTFDDDGEFWMSIQDFLSNFTTVEICDVTPEVFDHDDSDDDDENGTQGTVEPVQKRWRMVMYEGAWAAHHSAGGCRNFINTFASNPQYTVHLEDPDEDDDDDLCTMVVSLMQKNVRQLKRYGVDYVPIGFTIYKLPEDMQPGQKLDTEFFKYNPSLAKVPFFLNTREITTRFRFPPGNYVIIPSTFEPEMTGEFLLRIFTEAKRK